MKATFRYVHLDHSMALEEHVEKKLESMGHLLSGYDELRADVELEKTTEHHKSGDIFKAHIRLHIEGHALDAEAKGGDMYQVVDIVRDTLYGAVQRFKEQDVARKRARE